MQFLGDGLYEEILESYHLQRSPFLVQATCKSCTQPDHLFASSNFPWKHLVKVCSGEERFESRDITIIINIGRTLILALPQKQNGRPIECITLLSIISSLKRRVQRLWRLIYGLLTMAMVVGPLMGVNDLCKVRNWRVAKSRIFLIPINNTNELRLLVSMCFWVKKELTRGQISSKNNSIWGWTSVFVSSSQPLHQLDDWIASFCIALFKSRNYGNYVRAYMHFISRWN